MRKKVVCMQGAAYSVYVCCYALMALVLNSIDAYALGITPATKDIVFEPGTEKTVVYRIYNTEKKDFTVTVNITGNLAKYIVAEPQKIVFSKDDAVKSFTLTLKMPEKIEGKETLTISVMHEGVPEQGLGAKLNLAAPTGFAADEKKVASVSAIEQRKERPWLLLASIVLFVLVIGNAVYFTFAVRSSPVNDIQSMEGGVVVQNAHESSVEQQAVQSAMHNIAPSLLHNRLAFAEGKQITSLRELCYFLQNIDDTTFNQLVNENKNDVSIWLDEVINEPKIALRIYDLKTRTEIIKELENYITTKNEAEELKKEIESLKSELEFL
ncbi:MAG: hypothetical protein QXK37_00640 [Candidatus Woesearchaeota archaeon]